MEVLRRKPVMFLVAGACLVVLTFGIRTAADVLNPVLMATFLALLLQPLAEWLEERAKFPAGLALTAVVLVVVVAGLMVVGFMVVSLQEVVAAAPEYRDRLVDQAKALDRTLENLARRFNIGPAPADGDVVDLAHFFTQILTSPGFGRAMLSFSQSLAGSLGNLLLTFFIFAFTLGGVARLDTRLEAGTERSDGLAARFMAFSVTIRRYMAVRAVLGLVASVLNYVLLLVLGVDFALLWAVLSFVLSFVPNIGYTLSVIPPVLLALIAGGWKSALFVFIGYTIINNVVDNVVGPRYVGQQMKMSPLLSFLSVIIWAWVLGPTGAILAIPLTVFLREVAMAEVDEDEPAAPAAPPPPAQAPPPPPPEPVMVPTGAVE